MSRPAFSGSSARSGAQRRGRQPQRPSMRQSGKRSRARASGTRSSISSFYRGGGPDDRDAEDEDDGGDREASAQRLQELVFSRPPGRAACGRDSGAADMWSDMKRSGRMLKRFARRSGHKMRELWNVGRDSLASSWYKTKLEYADGQQPADEDAFTSTDEDDEERFEARVIYLPRDGMDEARRQRERRRERRQKLRPHSFTRRPDGRAQGEQPQEQQQQRERRRDYADDDKDADEEQ